MQAIDLILQVRTRLNDLDSKKWNDRELMDSLNNAYICLARNARLLIQDCKYAITRMGKSHKQLPTNFIDIVMVKKGKQKIRILRYESFLEDEALSGVCINNNIIMFNNLGSGTYKLFYYCYYILVDKADKLLVPQVCFNTLVYHTCYFALQKKPNQSALQEAQMYFGLYQDEFNRAKYDINKSRDKKLATSPYILV